jgi:hypothetical protein
MVEYTQKIRAIARKLLEKGTVDVFIGYRKGSVPMMNEPMLIKDPSESDLLHWDSHCGLNLCNYITKRTDRIGIVANGCNSRNIVTHIVENQIKREQLYIVGIPCTGMIDHRAVKRAVGNREILDVAEEGESFTVSGNGFRNTFAKKDFLRSNCVLCLHRNPVEYDEMAADRVAEQEGVNPFQGIEEVERKSPEEKQKFFKELLRVPQRLSALLLPHLFRRRVEPPVGRKEHRSCGYHDLSLPPCIPLCRAVHGLRRL